MWRTKEKSDETHWNEVSASNEQNWVAHEWGQDLKKKSPREIIAWSNQRKARVKTWKREAETVRRVRRIRRGDVHMSDLLMSLIIITDQMGKLMIC